MIFPSPQVVFGLFLLSIAVTLVFDIKYNPFGNSEDDIWIELTTLTNLILLVLLHYQDHHQQTAKWPPVCRWFSSLLRDDKTSWHQLRDWTKKRLFSHVYSWPTVGNSVPTVFTRFWYCTEQGLPIRLKNKRRLDYLSSYATCNELIGNRWKLVEHQFNACVDAA